MLWQCLLAITEGLRSIPFKIDGMALLLYLLPLITAKELGELMNHVSDVPCLNVFCFKYENIMLLEKTQFSCIKK